MRIYIAVDGVPLTREHSSMPEHPESFPVNALVPIPGTPLEDNEVSVALGIPTVLDSVVLADPIPYPSSNDSHCTHCSSGNNNQTCCGAQHSRRVGANDVFHGGSQRCLYRRADVDNTL